MAVFVVTNLILALRVLDILVVLVHLGVSGLDGSLSGGLSSVIWLSLLSTVVTLVHLGVGSLEDCLGSSLDSVTRMSLLRTLVTLIVLGASNLDDNLRSVIGLSLVRTFVILIRLVASSLESFLDSSLNSFIRDTIILIHFVVLGQVARTLPVDHQIISNGCPERRVSRVDDIEVESTTAELPNVGEDLHAREEKLRDLGLNEKLKVAGSAVTTDGGSILRTGATRVPLRTLLAAHVDDRLARVAEQPGPQLTNGGQVLCKGVVEAQAAHAWLVDADNFEAINVLDFLGSESLVFDLHQETGGNPVGGSSGNCMSDDFLGEVAGQGGAVDLFGLSPVVVVNGVLEVVASKEHRA